MQFRVSSAFDDFDDVSAVERGFKLREPIKPRDCKIQVEETVREPDPYHPKVRTMLKESLDSSLQPFDPSTFRKMNSEDYEIQTNPLGLPSDKPPCYLPQENDDHVVVPSAEVGQMGPIGPWATGRVDWSSLSGLTGTRPVVNSYSVTRYSTNEWRRRNYDTLKAANDAIEKSLV